MNSLGEQVHVASWPSFSLYASGPCAEAAERAWGLSKYALEGSCCARAGGDHQQTWVYRMVDTPERAALIEVGGGGTCISVRTEPPSPVRRPGTRRPSSTPTSISTTSPGRRTSPIPRATMPGRMCPPAVGSYAAGPVQEWSGQLSSTARTGQLACGWRGGSGTYGSSEPANTSSAAQPALLGVGVAQRRARVPCATPPGVPSRPSASSASPTPFAMAVTPSWWAVERGTSTVSTRAAQAVASADTHPRQVRGREL